MKTLNSNNLAAGVDIDIDNSDEHKALLDKLANLRTCLKTVSVKQLKLIQTIVIKDKLASSLNNLAKQLEAGGEIAKLVDALCAEVPVIQAIEILLKKAVTELNTIYQMIMQDFPDNSDGIIAKAILTNVLGQLDTTVKVLYQDAPKYPWDNFKPYLEQQYIQNNQTLREGLDRALKSLQGKFKARYQKPEGQLLTCFISYAWPLLPTDEIDETWTQSFIERLALQLGTAGIDVYLDTLKSVPGMDIIHYMKKYTTESDFIIVMGTQSLHEKFYNPVKYKSRINQELAHIWDRIPKDEKRGKPWRTFGILVSGTNQKSFPEEMPYKKNTLSFQDESYLAILRQWLAVLYADGDKQLEREFLKLWDDELKKIPEMSQTIVVSQPQLKACYLNYKQKQQEKFGKEYQTRLELKQKQQVEVEYNSGLSMPPVQNNLAKPLNYLVPHQALGVMLEYTQKPRLSSEPAPHPILIKGVAGSGKTTLAEALLLELQTGHHYPMVWRLRCDNRVAVLNSLIQWAQAYKPELAPNDKEQLDKFCDRAFLLLTGYLQTYTRWAVLFDNVEALEDIEPYFSRLQQLAKGSAVLIITSRNATIAKLTSRNWQPYDISGGLLKDKAISLLEKITLLKDSSGASELAKMLDYLPLSLSTAAVYIQLKNEKRRNKAAKLLTYSDYQKLLLTKIQALEEKQAAMREQQHPTHDKTDRTSLGYTFTQHAVISLSLQAAYHGAAIEYEIFLFYAASLHSGPIARSMLKSFAEEMHSAYPDFPKGLSQYLEPLEKQSLIYETVPLNQAITMPSNQHDAIKNAHIVQMSAMLEKLNLTPAISEDNTSFALPNVARANKLVDPQSGDEFFRQSVAGDGDCGYTAFGITREDAFKQLTSNLNNIVNLIKPAVAEALLLNNFFNDLKEKGIIQKTITREQVEANDKTLLALYANDLAVISAYLKYDVCDKRIDLGWTHPCILQALAAIQKIEIFIWRLDEQGQLTPHTQYHHHKPATVAERVDLLFANNNHFERLERVTPHTVVDKDNAPVEQLVLVQSKSQKNEPLSVKLVDTLTQTSSQTLGKDTPSGSAWFATSPPEPRYFIHQVTRNIIIQMYLDAAETDNRIKACMLSIVGLHNRLLFKAYDRAHANYAVELAAHTQHFLNILTPFLVKNGSKHLHAIRMNLSGFYALTGQILTAKSLLEKEFERIKADKVYDNDDQVRLLNALVSIYSAVGDEAQANVTLEKTQTLQKQSAKNEINNLMTMANFAATKEAAGELSTAKEMYEQLLHKQLKTEDNIETADLSIKLANIYIYQNQLNAAKLLLSKAAPIYDKHYGEEHIQTASLKRSLANLYIASAHYEKAEQLLLQLYAIEKNYYGSGNLALLSTISALAGVYERMNRLEAAERLMLGSLKAAEQYFGGDHITISQYLLNLAEFYYKQNKLDIAETLLKRGLSILDAKKIVNEALIKIVTYLTQIYCKLIKVKELQTLSARFESLISHIKLNFGEKHPNLFAIYKSFALAHTALKQAEEPFHQEKIFNYASAAVDIMEYNKMGSVDEYCSLYGILGTEYYSIGKWPEALNYFEKALPYYRRYYGERSKEVIHLTVLLAETYFNIPQHAPPISILESLLALLKSHYGTMHRSTILSYRRLIDAYFSAKMFSKYTLLMEEAMPFFINYYGETSIEPANYLYDLATVYKLLGQTSELIGKEKIALEKARDIYQHPSNNKTSYVAKLSLELGILNIREANYTSALENLNQAVDSVLMNSSVPHLPYIQWVANWLIGKLNTQVNLVPLQSDCDIEHLFKKTFLSMQNEDYQQAVNYCYVSILRAYHVANVWHNLACCYQALKNDAEAEAAFKVALTCELKSPGLYLDYGLFLYRKGQILAAKQPLQTALQMAKDETATFSKGELALLPDSLKNAIKGKEKISAKRLAEYALTLCQPIENLVNTAKSSTSSLSVSEQTLTLFSQNNQQEKSVSPGYANPTPEKSRNLCEFHP